MALRWRDAASAELKNRCCERPSEGTYDSARHRYLDNVIVFARLKGGARAWWLVTRDGQPMITSAKVLDATPGSGSSTRSR